MYSRVIAGYLYHFCTDCHTRPTPMSSRPRELSTLAIAMLSRSLSLFGTVYLCQGGASRMRRNCMCATRNQKRGLRARECTQPGLRRQSRIRQSARAGNRTGDLMHVRTFCYAQSIQGNQPALGFATNVTCRGEKALPGMYSRVIAGYLYNFCTDCHTMPV